MFVKTLEKYLNFCLWQYHLPVRSCRAHCIKNIYKIKLNFRDTVKKLAKLSDLSASPEKSSMTISLSDILFFPTIISISLSTCFFLGKKVRCILNSSIYWGYLKFTYFWKQADMFFTVSLKSGILDVQNILFNSPNKLFFAKFCINVAFPHPVCPMIKMLRSNFCRCSCNLLPWSFKKYILCIF